MTEPQPPPIAIAEQRRRLRRVEKIARALGFVGTIEYRHELRGTGGAQYVKAVLPENDLLIVDARAFERDADAEEFSLDAIVAHECGHQLILRHPALRRMTAAYAKLASEEVLASIVGSILVAGATDQADLLAKAKFDATGSGSDPVRVEELVEQVRQYLIEVLR